MMASFEPTPMRFSNSTSDKPDFRGKPKVRRLGSLVTLVGIIGAFVGAFVWFASMVTERTTAQLASDPVMTTLPAPSSN